MFGIESVCALKEFVVSFNKYFFADAAEWAVAQTRQTLSHTWLNHFVSSIYNRIWGGSVVLLY